MKVKIMETKTYDGADGTTYTETETAVTITVTGKPLENLRAIAAAMNETDWCDNDNTAATVLDGFVVGSSLSDLGTPVKMYRDICVGGVGEITTLILDAIDTGHPDESPESKARLAALRAAFVRHGVSA